MASLPDYAENFYKYHPLQISLYDPVDKKVAQTYILLGNVPSSVSASAQKDKWSERDATALKDFYGLDWQAILTPRGLEPPPSTDTVVGGEDHCFGQLDDFDDFEVFTDETHANYIREEPLFVESTANIKETADNPPAKHASGVVFSGYGAYPEDTFADLRETIYAVCGIPPYRQHLFYLTNGMGQSEVSRSPQTQFVHTTYRLIVDGVQIPVDIRLYGTVGSIVGFTHWDNDQQIGGLYIDPYIEQHKENLRVEALDRFIALKGDRLDAISHVFVADLECLLKPHRQELIAALQDSYQFDLIYYGFIVKYWPQLSPDAFRLTVRSAVSGLGGRYPLLQPPLPDLRKKLNMQKTIIDNLYAKAPVIINRFSPETRQKTIDRPSVAVTAATLEVKPFLLSRTDLRFQINMRNIFDWLSASEGSPAMLVKFPLYSDQYRRLGRHALALKRHVSSYGAHDSPNLERFLNRPLRGTGIAFAIRIPTNTEQMHGRGRLAFITIYENGQYNVESTWAEDERLGFDEILETLEGIVSPILAKINAMGVAAFPSGGKLLKPKNCNGTRGRMKLSSLTVSTFWPQALSTSAFRELKQRWRQYETAGLVTIKGLQEAGVYSFMFQKGIVEYDQRLLERVTANCDSKTSTGYKGPTPFTYNQNTYSHLTDPAIAQRWDSLYGGRPIRIFHRSTDLKIEMSDITQGEFGRIWLYMFVFFDSLISGNGRLTAGILRPGERREALGRPSLRLLQERDPDLYDVRKYDAGATLYSVLCQHPRFPTIFSPEEYSGFSADKRNEMVEYWNFTEKRPAYYTCPDKEFPEFSLLGGRHPMGYCLPCCLKTKALPDSKRDIVNAICLSEHVFDEEKHGEEQESLSRRHVLSYGKSIANGRIGLPPRQITHGLLYATLADNHGYRLLGVEQSAPALSDAGFFYALARIVDKHPKEFARHLADIVRLSRETYYALGGGAASAFTSSTHLADTIMETFIEQKMQFTGFSPGGIAGGTWHAIIADLTRIGYSIHTINFVDEKGNGDIVFECSPVTKSALNCFAYGTEEIKVAVIFINGGGRSGVYPMVAIDHSEYMRHGAITKRYFSGLEKNSTQGSDEIVGILADMVTSYKSKLEESGMKIRNWQLVDVQRFIKVSNRFVISRLLINMHNYCYGALVKKKEGGEESYIPIEYSSFTNAQTPISYTPRPDEDSSAAALWELLHEMNAYARDTGGLVEISAKTVLKDKEKLSVGFIGAGVRGEIGLYYFHSPAGSVYYEDLPSVILPYDPRRIDKAILANWKKTCDPTKLSHYKKARRALYDNYLYRFFLAEFGGILHKERNTPARDRIKDLIGTTDFSNPASSNRLRLSLIEIVPPGDDLNKIYQIMTESYRRGPFAQGGIKQTFIDTIETSVFGFDRITLLRLRALEGPRAVKKALHTIMQKSVEILEEPAIEDFMNIYVACGVPTSIERKQCTNGVRLNNGEGRLQISKKKYDNLLEILSADISNPTKTFNLATMLSGVVDELKFIQHPGEHIEVKSSK